MAGSSSSSGGLCNYDVFLSFRGEDTRKIFVGHLYRALEQKAINTFIDSEDLRKGNKISELLNAIEDSRISIVVLSENYASSSWCLKELVKILECRDTNNQIVVPIFYQVDPSHIRKLDGKFGQTFADKFGGADKQEWESWRSALTRVADLSGWDSTKYEDDGKLIEEIVADTFKNWIHISSSKATGLVGMDFHMKEMRLRLCPGASDVRVVGIWGMGGIGKTTIARAVYDEIACQFQHSCFLDNVKEAFINKREVQMQEELLSRLLKEKVQSVGLNRGGNMIMQRLGKKKILVVLDDVGNCAQIEVLLGNPHSFGVGSRIIVTTRDKQSLSGVDGLYQPKHLSHVEAIQLFMKYAFRQTQPTGEYNDLSRRAIHYAQGLPLALKVLGASLYNKTEREWTGVLEKLKKIPHIGIMDVLKTSIEGLDDSEKDTFLDIACFFRGQKKSFVTEVLDSCGFFPDTALSVLVDRALITISYFDELDMHDLLQEMGRGIVRQESIKYPEGRSRLWNYEDVNRVFTQSTATEAVECIVLDLSNSKFDLCIDIGAFGRMRKLRLLMIYYDMYILNNISYDEFDDDDDLVDGLEYICPSYDCKQHGRGNFESLSHELRILLWHGCPLNYLPSNFEPINLVRLDMRGSRIQQLWEGIKHMKKLKVILLSYCEYLVKIPDLSGATNLERLVLDGCSSLTEFYPSILVHQNLLTLSLKGCKELKIFPSSIHMKSLQKLDLSGCSNLDKFPEIAEVMEKLTKLHLYGTAIKELPSSINNLTRLPVLDLKGCRALKSLPTSIGMKSLRTLDLFGCSNLEEFPDILEEMEELRELRLRGTVIRKLKILPSPFAVKSLRSLDLSGCQNFEEFPEISEVMENLTELHLEETAIKELPSSINNLIGLVTLNIRGCRELKILPSPIAMKSLQSLVLSGCRNLEEFPEISEVMENLRELHLDWTAIKQLPSSINNLTGLMILNLIGCRKLKILPSPIAMKSLQCLVLSGCHNLEEFPEISEVMENLTELYLDETAIRELPSSINNLIGLVTLKLKGCRELKILPSPIAMKSLLSLYLSCCQNLEEFLEISEVMENLTELRLEETAIRQLPSSINNLTGLMILNLRGCRELKILPSPIAMKSLESLNLSGCQNLEEFPEISEVMEMLINLCLDETAIKELPSSIERLQGLKLVSTRNCRSLVSLPDSICNLAHLSSLDLSGCSKLSCLPENIGSLNSLTELEVQDSGIKQLPLSLSLLEKRRISLSLDGLNAMKIPISECWPSMFLSQHTDHLRHLDLTDCDLLELSESIAHLYSLESLKLCRNKFKSLPGTMNRLCRLIDLRLEACDRLKSIPELSSSINYIDAHDCISLETVSKPKPQHHTKHFFTFSNCFHLGQTNLFRDIVERHSHSQDNCLGPLRLKMSLPGNEVPDWFDHRSRGCSVSVQLPPNWFDSKFLGFAICAVRTRWGTNYHTSPLSAACLCTFKGNFGESSFSFDLLDSVFRIDRCLGSDHIFLGYVSWSECPLIEKGRLVNEIYYTEATFQIVVVSEFITEQIRITSCVVRLVYANQDEMLNLSVVQPQFHVDSCETGVSFMDPCEMRNKETEGAEITEVSREVESSEAGEGGDTCDILQLFPELSELGSHSGLLVPEPQVGERERDTCQRLQLCLELSELGSHSGLPVPEPQIREKERDTCHRLELFPEFSELGSHSGLPVPEPQIREKKRKSPWGFQ